MSAALDLDLDLDALLSAEVQCESIHPLGADAPECAIVATHRVSHACVRDGKPTNVCSPLADFIQVHLIVNPLARCACSGKPIAWCYTIEAL